MGVINSTNLLGFKSSQAMFDRLKKRLNSFDENGLIDSGDWHKHIKYILEQLGKAVYRECEAVLPVKNFKTKLPRNFGYFHLAMRCTFESKHVVAEQRPWIYYSDTEITENPDQCCITCCTDEKKAPKIIIRTYVNDSPLATSQPPTLLRLSSRVRDLCAEDCACLDVAGPDEIGVQDGYITSMFTDESIYLQYYGMPMDEYGLPMIPDNEDVEKAIEYYIITQELETLYLNSTVPNIVQTLGYFNPQFKDYMGQALYWAKLPSFASQLNSIRRMRASGKFFNFRDDKTVVQ